MIARSMIMMNGATAADAAAAAATSTAACAQSGPDRCDVDAPAPDCILSASRAAAAAFASIAAAVCGLQACLSSQLCSSLLQRRGAASFANDRSDRAGVQAERKSYLSCLVARRPKSL
mmetsp:Transcript_27278/g.82253  ORF Transcript_27278/g.82253 Transcript_27278/m.82253 type:complete len:118 (+) Transcript_27278:727-1080(+)